jgi:hypothetical protein
MCVQALPSGHAGSLERSARPSARSAPECGDCENRLFHWPGGSWIWLLFVTRSERTRVARSAPSQPRRSREFQLLEGRLDVQSCRPCWLRRGARCRVVQASLSFELFKSSDGYCWPICFHSSEVMRPHTEWPEGDQIGGDRSCPQSIVSLAGLRSPHELGRAMPHRRRFFLWAGFPRPESSGHDRRFDARGRRRRTCNA